LCSFWIEDDGETVKNKSTTMALICLFEPIKRDIWSFVNIVRFGWNIITCRWLSQHGHGENHLRHLIDKCSIYDDVQALEAYQWKHA
jgi:hypothetical protein